jgi:hypothetical protein
MKHLVFAFVAVIGSQALAFDGTHPGLPPSTATEATTSESSLTTTYSNDTSVYNDINARGSIYTKYGTSMTADEIRESMQNRRAERESLQESGPANGLPPGSSTTR